MAQGRDALEAALDLERRQLIRANEERLATYMQAAKPWAELWPALSRRLAGLELPQAHELLLARAQSVLPFTLPGARP